MRQPYQAALWSVLEDGVKVLLSIAAVILFVGLIYIVTNSIWKGIYLSRMAKSWTPVTGILISFEVDVQEDIDWSTIDASEYYQVLNNEEATNTTYIPGIKYVYTVNNKTYVSTSIYPYYNVTFDRSKMAVKVIRKLIHTPDQREITVYVKPSNPEDCYLLPTSAGAIIFVVVISLLIGLYAFFLPRKMIRNFRKSLQQFRSARNVPIGQGLTEGVAQVSKARKRLLGSLFFFIFLCVIYVIVPLHRGMDIKELYLMLADEVLPRKHTVGIMDQYAIEPKINTSLGYDKDGDIYEKYDSVFTLQINYHYTIGDSTYASSQIYEDYFGSYIELASSKEAQQLVEELCSSNGKELKVYYLRSDHREAYLTDQTGNRFFEFMYTFLSLFVLTVIAFGPLVFLGLSVQQVITSAISYRKSRRRQIDVKQA